MTTEETKREHTGRVENTATHLILWLDDSTCVQMQLENIASSVYSETQTEGSLDIKVALTPKTVGSNQLLLFVQTWPSSVAHNILLTLFTTGKTSCAGLIGRAYKVALTKAAA